MDSDRLSREPPSDLLPTSDELSVVSLSSLSRASSVAVIAVVAVNVFAGAREVRCSAARTNDIASFRIFFLKTTVSRERLDLTHAVNNLATDAGRERTTAAVNVVRSSF